MQSPVLHKASSLPALMGLRFILSLWILLNHLGFILDDFFHPGGWMYVIINNGYYAVDMFFILSGIVITHHYGTLLKSGKISDYGAFLWLRLARLYPLHLVTLIGVLCLVSLAPLAGYALTHPEDYQLGDFIENLFLIQAWHYNSHMSWNYFSWSISAEWLAYLLTPILFTIFYRHYKLPVLWILVCGLLAVVPMLQMYDLFTNHLASPVIRVLTAFCVGICLCQISQRSVISGTLFSMSAVTTIVVLCAEHVAQGKHFGFALYPACIGLASLIQATPDRPSLPQRVLQHPLMNYGGEIAFALYMTQFVVLMPLKKIWPHAVYNHANVMAQLLYLAAITAIIFAATLLAHLVVEQPARYWLRQRNPFRH